MLCQPHLALEEGRKIMMMNIIKQYLNSSGCADGLHSLRGAIRIEWESDVSPPRRALDGVASVASVNGRALILYSGVLVQG